MRLLIGIEIFLSSSCNQSIFQSSSLQMSKEQFTSVILPLQHKLYRYALSIVFEVALAEDIVQEVLLKLWKHRERLKEIDNKEAWCIRLTRNAALDKLKSANRKAEPIDTAIYQLAAASFPDKETVDKDLIEAIKGMMEDLPEKQKEIFRLRELLGYSNAEIEDIMALDSNQVKVNLFRARKKIRSKLTQLINYGL